MAKQQLLLVQDVDDLGKSGEVVAVRAGYARNFLLPQQKAVVANRHTLRMQEKLKVERAKKSDIDRQESEELAKKISNVTLAIHVKVDPEGKMYGSVSAQDVVELFEKENLPITRRNVQLKHPIKETGVFEITLKLKEGVQTVFNLKVIPEKDKSAGAEFVDLKSMSESLKEEPKASEKTKDAQSESEEK